MILKYINKNIKTLLVLPFLLLGMVQTMSATHIVGGDMTYRYLGNGQYEISLTLRRDCGLGQVGYDDPAAVGIFAGDDASLLQDVRIPFFASDTLNNTIVSACGFEGSEVCVQRSTYRDTINLPFRAGGYIVAYQRCCRNESINNIINPLETGTTEWVEISEEAMTIENSSPTFNQWPDIYICANQPLSFDHSATDVDGDSLVYKVCTPYLGGTFANPRPRPPFSPPYEQILWQSPYSLNNMLGGTPLTIDPATGLVTATPNLVGQFLVGICVEEYRNGVLISTVRRDFQYNVRVCSDPVLANFTPKVNACDSLNFTFENTTINGESYEWNFNYPDTSAVYQSTVESPSFTYTAPGTYLVQLTGKSSNGACDSIITKTVIASIGANTPSLNFVAPSLALCAGESSPLLVNPNPDYVYMWTPTEGLDLTDPANPIFVGNMSAIYNVTVINETECSATGSIEITIKEGTSPLVISGPTDICGQSVALAATGGSQTSTFEWSSDPLFTTILSTDATLNTSLIGGSTVFYVRTVGGECGNVIDSVLVTDQSISLTYADTISICRDGSVDISVINNINDHDMTYLWNDDHVVSGGNTNIVTITTLADDADSFSLVGTATNQFGCEQAITIFVGIINQEEVDFTAALQSCEDLTMCFNIAGSFEGNVLWDFGTDLPINTSNEAAPCFEYKLAGTYTVTLTSLSTGCPFAPLTKEIVVPSIGDQTVVVTSQLVNCNDHEVCFSIEGNFLGNILWNFDDPNSPDNTSTSGIPCHAFSAPGTYNVTLTNQNLLCPFATVTYQVVIAPDLVIAPIADQIICEGESTTLTATSNFADATYTWFNEAGTQISDMAAVTINPMEDVTLSVVAQNAQGCTDTAFVTVRMFKFDFAVELPAIICPNEEFVVRVNIANPDNYGYQWSPTECIVAGGTTNQPILNAVPGKTISLVITNLATGCQETRVISPDIEAPLVYSFSGDLCNNQASTLNLSITNPGQYTYQWSPASAIVSGGNTANPEVSVGPNQVLTVIVTNTATGCTNELTYTPNVLPSLEVVFTEPTVDISQGKDTDLDIKNPISGASYVWSTGETGTSINVDPIETTTYSVTVTDANGCTGIGQVTVTVRIVGCSDKDEYLPNAFTPNGDAINDILYVKSNVITELTFVIYNRWGQEMFSTTDINQGWDGTYKGDKLSPDAYAYYIQATCINGDSFIKKGNVSILK